MKILISFLLGVTAPLLANKMPSDEVLEEKCKDSNITQFNSYTTHEYMTGDIIYSSDLDINRKTAVAVFTNGRMYLRKSAIEVMDENSFLKVFDRVHNKHKRSKEENKRICKIVEMEIWKRSMSKESK